MLKLRRLTGTLAIPETAGLGPAIVERISQALQSEGGRNIAASGMVIEFDGLTGTLSASPLVNIEHGRLTIEDRPIRRRLAFCIEIENWLFVTSGILFIVAVAVTISGAGMFYFIVRLGLFLFPFVCLYSLFLRYRFRRWLKAMLIK